ncbi:MAG TPA: hypothetical protein VGI35_00295 [Steroidobacteraceae bacterium]
MTTVATFEEPVFVPEATQLLLLLLELLEVVELLELELLELTVELELLPNPLPFEFELLEHAATPRAMSIIAIERLINERKSELSGDRFGGR